MDTTMLYLYTLGLILPPAAVIAGLAMLVIPRKAEPALHARVSRAA